MDSVRWSAITKSFVEGGKYCCIRRTTLLYGARFGAAEMVICAVDERMKEFDRREVGNGNRKMENSKNSVL